MKYRYWIKADDEKLLSEYEEKGVQKLNNCPNCGSKRINKVTTWVGNARYGYYCIDCLTEFTLQGERIPPLYAEGMEG